MQKKIKISLLITVAFFIIWLIVILAFVTVTGNDKIPNYFNYPIIAVFATWFLIGTYCLIKYFKDVKEAIVSFINE